VASQSWGPAKTPLLRAARRPSNGVDHEAAPEEESIVGVHCFAIAFEHPQVPLAGRRQEMTGKEAGGQ
jgi:hypothetical protein